TVDRRRADLDQCPVHDARIGRARGHVVKPAEEEDRGADDDEDRKDADCCQSSHGHLPYRNRTGGFRATQTTWSATPRIAVMIQEIALLDSHLGRHATRRSDSAAGSTGSYR